jgi:hypothetical protein
MKREIVMVCDYGEIEEIIHATYGKHYEIPSGDELSNDSSLTFSCAKGVLDQYENETLNKFIATGHGDWLLNILVADLCNKGKLAEGKYVMSISW